MVSQQKIQGLIGVILLIGTLLATFIVMIGGAMYLIQNGGDTLQSELLNNSTHAVSIVDVWRFAFSFTPLGIVQLGLLLLIATQTIRVFLLCGFYFVNRDIPFTIISFFILVVLIYSSCWRH